MDKGSGNQLIRDSRLRRFLISWRSGEKKRRAASVLDSCQEVKAKEYPVLSV